MPRAVDTYPAGWLTQFRRGVIAGASVELLAFMILAVPVMLAWIVPGSDPASATSAARAAALSLLSGLHGGTVLAGAASTLTPLAVTAFVGWMIWGPARRMDSTSGFLGLVAGFAGTSAGLARWSSLGQTYAPVTRTAVASALFLLTLGSLARWGPAIWLRCGQRRRAVLKASCAVSALYTAVAALLVLTMVVLHRSQVTALQGQVAPGVGGLGLALLAVGAAPNAVIAVIGYLAGPGFSVGTHTSVSVQATSRGALPDFPLLAALPGASGRSWVGGTAIIGCAVIASALLIAMIKPTGRGWRGLLDLAASSAVVGISFGMAAILAHGGIAGGALAAVGVSAWKVTIAGAAIVLLCSWLAAGVWAVTASLRDGRSPVSIGRLPSQAGPDPAGSDAAALDPAGLDPAGLDAAGLDAAGRDAAGRDAAGPDAAEVIEPAVAGSVDTLAGRIRRAG